LGADVVGRGGLGMTRTGRVMLSITALWLPVTIAACRSWRAEPLNSVAPVAVRHPSAVRLTRVDGSRVVLRYPALVADTLVGSYSVGSQDAEARIALADIRALETRGFSGARTAALAGVVAAVVAVVKVHTACSGCACD